VQRLRDGEGLVTSTVGHRFVDGLAGRCEHEHFLACPVCGGAQRFEGVRFSRTRGSLQRLHQKW
jgi:hypothetical protein